MDYNTTTDRTDSPIVYIREYTIDLSYKDQYEEDLRRRQAEHLDRVFGRQDANWRPCLHDNCQSCLGTGVKSDGSACIHNLSCPCPKCTPYY